MSVFQDHLTQKLGLAEVFDQSTYAWPLHVAWTSHSMMLYPARNRLKLHCLSALPLEVSIFILLHAIG